MQIFPAKLKFEDLFETTIKAKSKTKSVPLGNKQNWICVDSELGGLY